MTDQLKTIFKQKQQQGLPVFVTFVTAGYPDPNDTVPILLAMENGGADVIELGVPFSDPMADGPVIQETNSVALQHDVDYAKCLSLIAEARSRGLKAPVLLMGYYNPILAFGEDKAIKGAKEAGANGFIIVDLPPEEASAFREKCLREKMSYVPLIAPSTSIQRVRFLSTIADSFIYVVSKMGTTGSSADVAINDELPLLLKRVKEFTKVPLAVGFGVATKTQFDTVARAGADGVVVGSRIAKVIKHATPGGAIAEVEAYCRSLSAAQSSGSNTTVAEMDVTAADPPAHIQVVEKEVLPHRFGQYGGQYVPEALFNCLSELELAHQQATKDPAFWEEFQSYFGYMNRPSKLYFAEKMTKEAGGGQIWFKREDLNHTGSHKINNAIGQILLARRLGKTRIIAETGAGQHGVATATVCARFGLECVVYMGSEDVRRQALNVFRIRMLGAKVVPVTSGSQTLKDAVNEAMRDWVTNLSTTHYLVGSAIGPHPFPTIVRDFQKVIGSEIRAQFRELCGKLPDAIVACVGGGSNAIGAFYDFIPEKNVRLVGVEAGGEGINSGKHSATLACGDPGVLHGVRTYILQSKTGQIVETHSISAGLDYPGVGPEHAWLKDTGRAEYITATDEEALRGFRICTQLEGIIPALESSHAIWAGFKLAKNMNTSDSVVVCLSGRGDKDVEQISQLLPGQWSQKLDWHVE